MDRRSKGNGNGGDSGGTPDKPSILEGNTNTKGTHIITRYKNFIVFILR